MLASVRRARVMVITTHTRVRQFGVVRISPGFKGQSPLICLNSLWYVG